MSIRLPRVPMYAILFKDALSGKIFANSSHYSLRGSTSVVSLQLIDPYYTLPSSEKMMHVLKHPSTVLIDKQQIQASLEARRLGFYRSMTRHGSRRGEAFIARVNSKNCPIIIDWDKTYDELERVCQPYTALHINAVFKVKN